MYVTAYYQTHASTPMNNILELGGGFGRLSTLAFYRALNYSHTLFDPASDHILQAIQGKFDNAQQVA